MEDKNKEGNRKGKWTYGGMKAENMIDFGIVNQIAWEKIQRFEIDERIDSDHMPLKIQIKNGKKKEEIKVRKQRKIYNNDKVV